MISIDHPSEKMKKKHSSIALLSHYSRTNWISYRVCTINHQCQYQGYADFTIVSVIHQRTGSNLLFIPRFVVRVWVVNYFLWQIKWLSETLMDWAVLLYSDKLFFQLTSRGAKIGCCVQKNKKVYVCRILF